MLEEPNVFILQNVNGKLDVDNLRKNQSRSIVLRVGFAQLVRHALF